MVIFSRDYSTGRINLYHAMVTIGGLLSSFLYIQQKNGKKSKYYGLIRINV
jgi:hypothetical protein